MSREVFVASACVPADDMSSAITALANEEIQHIELTGGTRPNPDLERDLLWLRDQGELHFQVHNYFPPPDVPFVLNLASLDSEVHRRSMDHCRGALRLAASIGSDVYGVHAGFLLDIPVNQIGRPVGEAPLFPRDAAFERFCASVTELTATAADLGVTLYVENNVVSAGNAARFDEVPFLLTNAADHAELAAEMPVRLLLDLAHLHVTCHSYGFDFEAEVAALWSHSDYLHVSDNDGTADSNDPLRPGSAIVEALRTHPLEDKRVTLEVYGGMPAVRDSLAVFAGLRS